MERIRELGGEIDGNWWLVECVNRNSTDAFQILDLDNCVAEL